MPGSDTVLRRSSLSYSCLKARLNLKPACTGASVITTRSVAPRRTPNRRPELRAALNGSAGTSSDEDNTVLHSSLPIAINLENLDISQLQTALLHAVSAEDYGLAARIRDRLQQLTKQAKTRTGTWSACGHLPDWLVDRAERLGYRWPTDLAQRCVPVLQSRSDAVIEGELGVGKMLAYLMPALAGLRYPPEVYSDDMKGPQCLVLVPCQEVGVQVLQLVLKLYGNSVQAGDPTHTRTYFGPKGIQVRGVLSADDVIRAKGTKYLNSCHVVVATPACLEQVARDCPSVAEHLSLLVVDEVDVCWTQQTEAMTALMDAACRGMSKPQVVYASCRPCAGVCEEARKRGWLRDPTAIGTSLDMDPVDSRSPLLATHASMDEDLPPSPLSSPPDPFTQGLGDAVERLRAYEQYKAEVSKTVDDDIDVFYCAVMIAKHAYPKTRLEDCLAMIEDIAAQVKERLPPGNRYPLKVVAAINEVMYKVMGFSGNQQDYYDPQNSLINKVLERRLGLPITLSLVYMEVAKRVGLPMIGLNLPSHFMIKPNVDDMELIIDPFNNGDVCYLQDAEERLSVIMGMNVTLDANWVRTKQTFTNRSFLLRLLNNIKTVYWNASYAEECLHIVRYMRVTDPGMVSLIRDEGFCLYATKRYEECVEALNTYLSADPEAMDTMVVKSLIDKVKNKKGHKQRD